MHWRLFYSQYFFSTTFAIWCLFPQIYHCLFRKSKFTLTFWPYVEKNRHQHLFGIEEDQRRSEHFVKAQKLWLPFWHGSLTQKAPWSNSIPTHTARKMKFPIKDSFVKLRILSHLLKKSLTESFIFCTVTVIPRCS